MAQLFISYARRDGRALADRLAADLAAKEHAPWLDRSEIEGGEQWSVAIEGAIDGCDALLAVLTQGAFESSVCRGEQSRALRKQKPVIPLLAQADADRPVYLETRHYLDFSAPEGYAASFALLLERVSRAEGVVWAELSPRVRARIDVETPVRSLAAALQAPAADWAQITDLARAQRERFFAALSSARARAGIFEPALYVSRPDEERELAEFAAGEAAALVVVGDSGVGKTNLLCHWARAQAEAGDAVLMFHCEKLAGAEVGRELAKDLGLADPAGLPAALAALAARAERERRRVVCVFDAVNDFRGRDDGPRELIAAIDALVRSLPGAGLQVVIACSTATWNRLERLGALDLDWPRYHRSRGQDRILLVPPFDGEQMAAAYRRYRDFFGLPAAVPEELPPGLGRCLRDPSLLRLLAETAAGGELAGEDLGVTERVYQSYYRERVRRKRDQLFVDELAQEMLAQERAALPVQSLMRHPRLGPEVLDEAPDGSFNVLLDEGVLMEVPGDLFTDDLVRFSYPAIGAYVLAGRLLRQDGPLQAGVETLLAAAPRLSLAWEAAATLLMARGEPDLFAALAGAADGERRELAVEGLVRAQAADDARARRLLGALLDSGSPERQRTALRAAYQIGPATRDLFLRAASSGDETLRQAVRDTLYLIWSGATQAAREQAASTIYFVWRHAPDFTWELMDELVGRLSWRHPIDAGRILGFVIDLSVTIYVNHCDRPEVAERTAALYHRLAVERLHLDRVNLGPALEQILLKAVSAVFARRILDWMLVSDLGPAEAFFALPGAERAKLERVAPLLDPAADLAAAEPLLAELLGSRLPVFRGAAALALAVHACAGFEASAAVHRRLAAALDGEGRLWQLVGFAVLLPATPPGWVALLEDLTRELLEGHPELFAERRGLLAAFDVLLVPLGLAYGKRGSGMPLYERMLEERLAGGRPEETARFVAALGPVGFYYPRAVLALLRPALGALAAEPAARDALVTALATMRTLHFDAVDAFMEEGGLDEALRRRVAAAAELTLVNRLVVLLGFYNNAVHYCVHYPRMRRGLAAAALELLARAKNASGFVAAYAGRAIAMARDAGFRLLEWTRPE